MPCQNSMLHDFHRDMDGPCLGPAGPGPDPPAGRGRAPLESVQRRDWRGPTTVTSASQAGPGGSSHGATLGDARCRHRLIGLGVTVAPRPPAPSRGPESIAAASLRLVTSALGPVQCAADLAPLLSDGRPYTSAVSTRPVTYMVVISKSASRGPALNPGSGRLSRRLQLVTVRAFI